MSSGEARFQSAKAPIFLRKYRPDHRGGELIGEINAIVRPSEDLTISNTIYSGERVVAEAFWNVKTETVYGGRVLR